MDRFFFAYWWLIFPIMGFVFGGFGMLMGYKMHKDRMDLLKTYIAQGKEPPAELMNHFNGGMNGYGGPGYGGWGWGYRSWRYGPYWEWRRCFVFTALAVGFGYAAYRYDGDQGPFTIVAVIMGALAIGSFLFALFVSRARSDGK